MNLYALLDVDLLRANSVSFEEFIEKCEKKKACLVQYRNKHADDEVKKKDLLAIKNMTNIPVIVNDSLDLIDYADGVHLGQEDISKIDNNILKAALTVRKKVGKKLFGLSTHNEQEIKIANNLPLDYIGLGAYRQTCTKEVNNELGEKISALALLSTHPVGAIGGVTLEDNIKNVKYYVIGSGLL